MQSLFDRMFLPPIKHKFYPTPKELRFIKPKNFVKWLNKIGEEIDHDDYCYSVTSMCEYSCLYICQKALKNNFDPTRLKICYGNYGWGEHYWMMLDDEWFVDLTLAQFIPDAPRLAITSRQEAVGMSAYHAYDENFYAQSYTEYLGEFFNPNISFF